MTESVIQIVYYVNTVIYLGMTYYAFSCIFEPATRKKWILLVYAAFFVLVSNPVLHFDSGWLNLAISTVFFLSVSLLFTGSIWARLLFACLLYINSVAAEAISFLSLNYIYYNQYGTAVPMEYIHNIGRTVTNVIFLPLLLVNVILFRKLFKRRIRSKQFKAPIAYTTSVVLMLGGIILIDLLFILAAMAEIHTNAIPIIIGQLAILLFIIWMYYTIHGHLETLEKSRLKDHMLERWEMQYQTVLNSQKVIAELNHNLRYHFLTLAGFLKNGEVEKAEAHIAEKIGDVDYIINTGNISIDAMLNYYRQRVRAALDIDLDVEIQVPPNMKLDANLIVTILGNAAENAMEACKHVDPASRYIQVKVTVTDNGALLIVIENPYAIEPISDRDGILITTKPDKRSHGLGLRSIRELLPENAGHVQYEYAKNRFRFMLIYYNVLEKSLSNITVE